VVRAWAHASSALAHSRYLTEIPEVSSPRLLFRRVYGTLFNGKIGYLIYLYFAIFLHLPILLFPACIACLLLLLEKTEVEINDYSVL
jgi:hypothetical protein